MKIIAHRGYSGKYPELTGEAYQKALELPIHGVETDVRLTRDGEIICFHDPVVTLEKEGLGRVSSYRLAQMRTLNMGTEEDPQSILTLGELVDLVLSFPGKHLYIELKHPVRYGRMLEEAVSNLLRRKGVHGDEHLHVISFSFQAISRMARLEPHLDRIALRRPFLKYFYPLDPQWGRPHGLGLSLARARVHPQLIGAKGLPTYLWTVNEDEDIRWALEQGVDMLATDEPEVALGVLAGSAG